MVTRDETITKTLDPEAATLSRDALAKVMYSRLFDWWVSLFYHDEYIFISASPYLEKEASKVLCHYSSILILYGLCRLVDKINSSIGQDPHSKYLIGVLDIYGFESFKTNRCLSGMLVIFVTG